MTVLDHPRTAEPTPERLAELDSLVAGTLPYLDTRWGNVAAEFLESQGYTREQIRDLAARAALEA